MSDFTSALHVSVLLPCLKCSDDLVRDIYHSVLDVIILFGTFFKGSRDEPFFISATYNVSMCVSNT